MLPPAPAIRYRFGRSCCTSRPSRPAPPGRLLRRRASGPAAGARQQRQQHGSAGGRVFPGSRGSCHPGDYIRQRGSASIRQLRSVCELRIYFSVGSFPSWRGADAGRAHEELLPVGERHVAAVRAIGAVLRTVAVHDDFGPHGKRLPGQAAPQQRIGRAAFDHPPLHRAVGLLDVDVDPGVRVDPFDPDHGALQLHRLVEVEFRRERMVRQRRRRRERDGRGDRRDGNDDDQLMAWPSPSLLRARSECLPSRSSPRGRRTRTGPRRW